MILFWKKTSKTPEENVDYRFVNFVNSDITGIQILVDEYKDIVYHYNQVAVKEQGEFATLEFNYTLVPIDDKDLSYLESDEKFKTLLGDILSSILTQKADNE
jgi:hypothetical protein